jgi:formylglycine-generating enzyme required for sulfatase activity
MVFVQGGNFEMGDHHGIGEADELPVHNVILDDFCIAEKEVTYFECIEFLNDFGVEGDGSYQGVSYIDVNDADCAISYNGSFYFESNGLNSNIQCAVSEVRWHGAVAFCNWLSQKDGLTACYDLSTWECNYDANGYRLPTEAEWEYAARGGIHWEDNYIYSGCGSNDIDDYLWYDNNSSSAIHIGGLLQPNQLGIYDMSGNVFEWCNDWYYNTYYSNSPEDNPTGPNNGTYKIARGGSWDQSSTESRVANRTKHLPDSSSYNNGFRYVRGF